jgi:hypothetical protein
MEEPSQAVAAVPQPLPEPLPEPGPAVEGIRAVEVVMRSTEAAVARIAEEARTEVRRLAQEADGTRAIEADARRREIARVRTELLDRATLLAQGFEEIFDLLDAADAELAKEGATPVGEAPPAAEPGAVRMVLRERRRITVAHDVEPAPQPRAAVQAPGHRRRWWRLWRRRAA